MNDTGVDAAGPVRAASPGARQSVARWAIGFGWVAVLVPFVVEAIAVVRASSIFLVGRVPDDAFYYLEVARRFGSGQGFTFDGVEGTTGFHPLWQAVLGGLSNLVPGQTAFLKASLLLALACLLGATLLTIRLVWRWLGPGPALIGAVVMIHGREAMPNFVDGMEGALTVLCFAGVATALAWYLRSPSLRRGIVVGALCALTVLARLDTVVVIWFVPVVMVARARTWRPVAWWAIGGAVALPWAVWYWFDYHHILTTSATIKQHLTETMVNRDYGGRLSTGFAREVVDLGNGYVRSLIGAANDSVLHGMTLFGWVAGVMVTLLALAGVAAAWTRSRGRAGAPASTGEAGASAWACATLGVMLAGKAVFDLVNAPQWASEWYSAPQRFGLTFAMGAAAWVGAVWLFERWRWAGVLAVAYLCLAALPLNLPDLARSTSTAARTHSWQDQIDLAASWVAAHGPPGLYGASSAGLLGYRLDGSRQVVDLDGLVNNYRFGELVDRGASLPDRFRATGVDYYVNLVSPSAARQLTCASVLWRSPGRIWVQDVHGGDVVAEPVAVYDVRNCRTRLH